MSRFDEQYRSMTIWELQEELEAIFAEIDRRWPLEGNAHVADADDMERMRALIRRFRLAAKGE